VHLITLTTDFGTCDWFVGTMKGVILGLQPRATVVDLTHEIPAGDVRAGAFALMAGCQFFPKGTVHVAVVDPGVGSARRAIAVQTENNFFVGPDNGVLSFALAREKIEAIRQLTNKKFFLKDVSHTFHGRDVFAPVAAHLSRGVPIQKLGPKVKNFVRFESSEPLRSHSIIKGEVVYIDRFGNAITNIPNETLSGGGWEVFIKAKRICGIESFYQSVKIGQALAMPGSSGFLEVAVNGGSAVRKLRLKIGGGVELRSQQT